MRPSMYYLYINLFVCMTVCLSMFLSMFVCVGCVPDRPREGGRGGGRRDAAALGPQARVRHL